MDASTARETVIRPKLQEVFGNTLADMLIMRATVAGLQARTEPDRLRLIVESICSNPKMVGMLGTSETERQKREWLGLA